MIRVRVRVRRRVRVSRVSRVSRVRVRVSVKGTCIFVTRGYKGVKVRARK